MRRLSLGIVSMIFATLVGIIFALHFGNVILLLNTMLVPILAIMGLMLGIVGYFERDKKRTPALVGMILNLVFLGWFGVLFIQSLSHSS